MKQCKTFLILLLGLFAAPGLLAQGVTFTFANGQLTGTGPYNYEVDVMMQADADGSYLGDTQIYINYNPLAFGDNVVANGKVLVSRSTLLGGANGGTDLYSIKNLTDNSSSRFAVTVGYNFENDPTLANQPTQTPTKLMHLQIQVGNRAWTSGLSFEGALMSKQQFLSDNFIQYGAVTATDTDDIVLGVEPVEIDAIPAQFLLHQNYPNPFNPETQIRFDLPAAGDVSLMVYDMLGRRVITLHQGSLTAGSYTLAWDGRNDAGDQVASGTYLLRLVSGKQQQIVKMLMMQ